MAAGSPSYYGSERFEKRLRARKRRDNIVIFVSSLSIVLAITFLAILLWSIVSQGWGAFVATKIRLSVTFAEEVLDPNDEGTVAALADADYSKLIDRALVQRFGEQEGREAQADLENMISPDADLRLQERLLDTPNLVGETREHWFLASAEIDQMYKGNRSRELPPDQRAVSDRQLNWMDQLDEAGDIDTRMSWTFLTGTDSRNASSAGILGALVGSMLTLAVTLILSFPIAVAAAIYLEEFAPKTWWTRAIEVNVNNLAAVPSIVYGLLGLTVFINWLAMPRSAPIVGGLVLTLLTLPIIIVAARSALKSVPPSVRDAALMVGASRQMTVFRQVVPVALPGMLTGTIIGMAQALGETAPLLLIGMIAFVASVPDGLTETATVLPAQIYIWFTNPETAYRERASGAIMILLAFMFALNGLAIFLRNRLQQER